MKEIMNKQKDNKLPDRIFKELKKKPSQKFCETLD